MGVMVKDVAQAIVDALNNVANSDKFTEEFTAVRAYTLTKDWSDYTEAPEVIVIPRKEINQPEDRGDDRFTLGVGIAVIRQVADTNVATIDPLILLPESIRDFLMNRDMAGCEYENVTLEVLYGHAELHEKSCLVTTLGADYWIDQ